MPILAPETVTVPPVAEKTFPHQWVYNLLVHAPSISEGRIVFELLPFNGTSGEIGPSANLETLSTDKAFLCLAEVPEVAAAFAAISAAIDPFRQWIAAQSEEELEELPE